MSTPHATAPGAPLDTRARILEVASELFALHGYAGVGMRVVAERAGLSKSALFHHYPTKLALYGAVLCRILERLQAHAALAALATDAEDPMAQMQAWVGAVFDTLAADPRSAPLLQRALLEEEPLEPGDALRASELIGKGLASAQALLTRGMDSGRFRRVPRRQTIQSAIGLIVYHFASGEFGERLMGESIYSPTQVAARKQHVLELLGQWLKVDG